MPLAVIATRARQGMQAPKVTVEVHIANGLPAFHIVGLPDAAVRESRERVRSAILNSGFDFPQRRITINLAPADLPKDGCRFDLPIAVGILQASEQLPSQLALDEFEFLGELALSGALKPVTGVLSAAMAAGSQAHKLLVAPANVAEASLPAQARIYTCETLSEVAASLAQPEAPLRTTQAAPAASDEVYPDMADVKGQHLAKRALEVAAAGQHNLLLMGPPGAGKSMLAARLPGILPPMSATEMLETTALHSLAGCTPTAHYARPLRAPHHTASVAALAGGGSPPQPGEISLAHNGVLFLDELPEFSRKALEVMREPLETGEIALSRASGKAVYPARFQLIAALNPCPCGHPERPPEHCTNPQQCCNRYQSKLSGPLLDRIDMHIQVDAVPPHELQGMAPGEPSASIRERICAARDIQLARQGCSNRNLQGKALDAHCALTEPDQRFLQSAVERLHLSARGYHRILRLARTLADLEQNETISKRQLTEALSYRALF